MAILSINAGSSSIKFALYPVENGKVGSATWTGDVQGLQPGGKPVMRSGDVQQPPVAIALNADDESAFSVALARIDHEVQLRGRSLQAVAHRIVHGGAQFAQSIRITARILEELEKLSALAPLHQPHNLEGVRKFASYFPDIPQIACFDTGFHQTMSAVEKRLALPRSLSEQGIRRYGFHGLSYRYVMQMLQKSTDRSQGRVVMAHLGNGSSVCAAYQGASVATSMGYSALDGLMMGTRCGSLDPGVLLDLLRQGWSRTDLETLLYKQSGLLGVSGLSADMRTLRTCDQPEAQQAIDLYTYRLRKEMGGLIALLQGIDVLAFTGGIGEHDAVIRCEVVQSMQWLGCHLDQDKNLAACGQSIQSIHAQNSTVEIWVVPTDEGRIAAQDAVRIISAASDPHE